MEPVFATASTAWRFAASASSDGAGSRIPPARSCAIELRVRGDGWERSLPAGGGRMREDVEQAFPGLVDAKFSGFTVTGYVERPSVRTLALEIAYADGARDTVDVTPSLQRAAKHARRWRELRWVADAAWRRLKHGDLRGLVRRIRSQNYTAPSPRRRRRRGHAAAEAAPGAAGGHRLRSQHGRRRERLSAAIDRRARRGRLVGGAVHLQSADARLSPLAPCGRRHSRPVSTLVVPRIGAAVRQRPRCRSLRQQPGVLRRPAAVRRMDGADARRAFGICDSR